MKCYQIPDANEDTGKGSRPFIARIAVRGKPLG